MKNLALLSISVLILFAACKKDQFITSPDALISLSTDEIKFDTVFTNSGSVTHFFKIINENNQKLKLSSVQLAGGTASFFRINVDGVTGFCSFDAGGLVNFGNDG